MDFDDILGANGNPVLTKTIKQDGVTSLFVRTYTPNDTVAQDFYDGLGTEIGNEVPIVFGEVMLTGQTTNSGAIRSDLDPNQIIKVIEFITSEGPAVGIKGVGDDKLTSVYVNGVAAKDATTGETSSKIGLKEIAALAVPTAVMAGVPYLRQFLGIDPVTGENIPDAAKALLGNSANAEAIALKDLNGVSISGTSNDKDMLIYDKTVNKWVNKTFIDIHKASGIEVTGLEVQSNGASLNADTDIMEFTGSGVTVTKTGDKKVTVAVTGGAGGSPGSGSSGGGGGTPGTPATGCAQYLMLPYPNAGENIVLRRNGSYIAGATSTTDLIWPETTTIQSLGVSLTSHSGLYDPLSTRFYSVAASPANTPVGYNFVSINQGWDPCLCDNGAWTITNTSGSIVHSTPISAAGYCGVVSPVIQEPLFRIANSDIVSFTQSSPTARFSVGNLLYGQAVGMNQVVFKVASINTPTSGDPTTGTIKTIEMAYTNTGDLVGFQNGTITAASSVTAIAVTITIATNRLRGGRVRMPGRGTRVVIGVVETSSTAPTTLIPDQTFLGSDNDLLSGKPSFRFNSDGIGYTTPSLVIKSVS